MTKYYARICWNSNDWIFPSGQAREQQDTYVSKAGFGTEEWLFNFAWLIDGFHYSFLQPVNKSFRKVSGKSLSLLLYSINSSQDRMYVAEITNCEVLTEAEAHVALSHYKKSGWLQSMKAQVANVKGDAEKLNASALSMFNIRFRPTDVNYQKRLAKPSDFILKLNRYSLVGANESIVEREWRAGRKGDQDIPTIQTVTRSGQPGVTYDPIEKALQAELMKLLKAHLGKDSLVEREADFIDITVRHGNRKIFIEIKSDSQARLAIRKALGQLLEYAYFESELKQTGAELVIVAPGLITKNVANYVKLLQTKFGIPVRYCSFALGETLPNNLLD
jgi:hypothetical protein